MSFSRILCDLSAEQISFLYASVEGAEKSKVRLERLYSGSVNGYGSEVFHERCDGISSTVTVCITPDNKIFGGYTDAKWDSDGSKHISCESMKSFLFRLSPGMEIFPQIAYPEYTIRGSSLWGPVFGYGADLTINNNPHTCSRSYSNLGYTYRSNTEYPDTTSLAGSETFTLKDIEVFRVMHV